MFDRLIEMDGDILLWIQENLRSDILSPVIKLITHLGDMGLIMILTSIVLMIIPKTRKLGFLCSAALVCSVIINNVIIKHAVLRVRPYEAVEGLQRIVGKAHDTSFPSGHAAGSFVLAAVIFRETPRKIGVPVLILALLIALSRLYVGVHYPTDVLVGMISGTLIGIATCFVYHKYIARSSAGLHRQPVQQES